MSDKDLLCDSDKIRNDLKKELSKFNFEKYRHYEVFKDIKLKPEEIIFALMNFMYVQSNTVDKNNGVLSYIGGISNADIKPIYKKLIEITNISIINIDNVMKGQEKNTDRYKTLELLYLSNKKSNEAYKLCLEDTKQNSNANSDKIKSLGIEAGRLYGNYLTKFNKIDFTK